MVVSRRRIAAVLSGCLLISVAVASGAIGAGLASAAPDTTACITALRADRAAALKLANDWIDAFNLGADESALDKANDNVLKYTRLSRDDYFRAYQAAYIGKKSTANSFVKKGNDANTLANKAIKAYNAQIAKINAKGNELDAEADALNAQVTATDQTCLGL